VAAAVAVAAVTAVVAAAVAEVAVSTAEDAVAAAKDSPSGTVPADVSVTPAHEPVAPVSGATARGSVASMSGSPASAARPVHARGSVASMSPSGSVADIPPPNQFGDGTQPAPKVSAEGTSPEAPAYRVPPELAVKATALGETWTAEYIRDLRSQQRAIAGGWPGTLREARRRVLAAMPRNLDPQHLEELAKITNLAARRGWESISEPDLEP